MCVWVCGVVFVVNIASLHCVVLFSYETNRVKRKGATPPHRAERVVRDLQGGLIAATSSPRSSMVPQIKHQHHHHTAHSSGTGSKQRRRRNSSDDSHEHLANLIPSPHLHARLTKVQFQLAIGKKIKKTNLVNKSSCPTNRLRENKKLVSN